MGIMNKLTENEIKELLKNGKDPIKILIERNKFLTKKDLIGSQEVDWVIPISIVYEIVNIVKTLNVNNETKNS